MQSHKSLHDFLNRYEDKPIPKVKDKKAAPLLRSPHEKHASLFDYIIREGSDNLFKMMLNHIDNEIFIELLFENSLILKYFTECSVRLEKMISLCNIDSLHKKTSSDFDLYLKFFCLYHLDDFKKNILCFLTPKTFTDLTDKQIADAMIFLSYHHKNQPLFSSYKQEYENLFLDLIGNKTRLTLYENLDKRVLIWDKNTSYRQFFSDHNVEILKKLEARKKEEKETPVVFHLKK